MVTLVPRIMIAGLAGDSGKTMVTLGLVSALRSRGCSVSTFKKGPDYIDPAWIGRTGGCPCRSLDTYMVGAKDVLRSFVTHARGTDIAVVEGNRGVYDGKDVWGTHSTAELAKLLRAPVLLVVDARKATRTVAALVKGCVDFDPELAIAGVILNRVAGDRHLGILRESIEEFTGVRVLGTVPQLNEGEGIIPQRHLGLVPPAEFEPDSRLAEALLKVSEDFDVDRILSIATAAEPLPAVEFGRQQHPKRRARIGYFRDQVFTFYYPENLDALETDGAQLVPVSSLEDSALPGDIDALYVGGGFPETHAQRLSDNASMMSSVRDAAMAGMPIYAECGGLIYLSRSLRWGDSRFPMAGIFDIDLEMHQRPFGHGYTLVRVDQRNPFYPVGTNILGHEFHYTAPVTGGADMPTCMSVTRGTGIGGARDGLVAGNTLALYTHVHADGTPDWAGGFVERAAEYARARHKEQTDNTTKLERHASWQR